MTVVIESSAAVLSLGRREHDRTEKRHLYEKHGVKEYWMIDPEPEMVGVLALVNGRYGLVKRSQAVDMLTSQLLPGSEVSFGYLFGGA